MKADADLRYWAHSDPLGRPKGHLDAKWQLLGEHLLEVSRIASGLAKAAQPADVALRQMAAVAGILHDYGKYRTCFQSMLDGESISCAHALHGALAARNLPAGAGRRDWAFPVVAAIAAHHAGLKNHSDLDRTTHPESSAVDAERDRFDAASIWVAACKDQPMIAKALRDFRSHGPISSKDLFTRMLLSCLVDADRLNTAGLQPRQASLEPELRLTQLVSSLRGVRKQAVFNGGSTTVLFIRDQVQELCAAAARSEARLLSLTVPTGGGKTLAAMRFALERARQKPEDVRRVVVVIPYLAIIEQNAGVYREIFGDDALLEHHSGAVQRLHKKQRGGEHVFAPQHEEGEREGRRQRLLETENWDAPLIVTTSVRFFESLFSNHPSDLRRIHNIARSVIILDEVQTLPRRLLKPLLGILRELTEDWGCTIVLSTATQPAFEATRASQGYLWPRGTLTPIVPQEIAARMHSQLRRVRIEWRLTETLSWENLAQELSQHQQVLCVLNIRDHVAAVYAALREQLPPGEHASVFHLSTRMCPQHRLDVLEQIRRCLNGGLPCRIVSSQLIEAGVDLSVPIAFRALGPLDSIVQVAGRVDREGKLTEAAGEPSGRLIIFRPEDERMPPHEYQHAAGITETLGKTVAPQTDDLKTMQQYFERYYGDADDRERGGDLARMRDNAWLQFATLAEEFEYINSRTQNVFAPYGAGAVLLEELKQKRFMDFNLLRKLQRYSVGLQPWETEKMSRSLYPVWEGSDLLRCSEAQYEEKGRGLLPEIPADRFMITS